MTAKPWRQSCKRYFFLKYLNTKYKILLRNVFEILLSNTSSSTLWSKIQNTKYFVRDCIWNTKYTKYSNLCFTLKTVSDVNKDLEPKAKAKDTGHKVKAKALGIKAKAKAKDFGPKAKAKDLRCQNQ